jgi:hypothetical protein
MMRGLLSPRAVIDWLYGTSEATTHLRNRKPDHTEWKVAAAVEGVLKHPCNTVTQSQSQNSHWMLPDVIAAVSKLVVDLRKTRHATPDMRPPDNDEDEIYEETIKYSHVLADCLVLWLLMLCICRAHMHAANVNDY